MHGLSVPLGKLGYHLPRTLSSAIASRSLSDDPGETHPPFRIREQIQSRAQLDNERSRQRNSQRMRGEPPRPIFRIGGSLIQSTASENGVGLQTIDAVKEGTLHNVEPPEKNLIHNDQAGSKKPSTFEVT